MKKRSITRAEILPPEEYAAIRTDKRREISEFKRARRVACGPDATFYFESYETMWYQVHEMLFIEKGGEAQIEDELRAYNPLIPGGLELVATVMIEIPDEQRRTRVLAGLGGIEHCMQLDIDGEIIKGSAEDDIDRTNAKGKASSVQFVRFTLNESQAERFRLPDSRVSVGIDHANYGHMAIINATVRASLEQDL